MNISHTQQTSSLPSLRMRFPERLKKITLFEAARTRGTVFRGAPGIGKTYLLALLLLADLFAGKPALIIDGVGSLKWLLLRLVLQQPEPQRATLLSRLRLWPVGHATRTYALPWLHPPGSHDVRAQRFLDTVMTLLPSLKDAPIMGRPSLFAVGEPTLMILSACAFQVTEALDFLYAVGEKENAWREQLYKAERIVPEAVKLFRQVYFQWPVTTRKERRYAFESHVYPYILSQTLKALVGSNRILDLAQAEQAGLTILVDISGIEGTMVRDQFTVHLFKFFLDYLRRRGVGAVKPWSLVLEETAVLLRNVALIPDISSMANQFRNHRLQATLSFQSITQLPEEMRSLLYAFGNHWIGRTSSREESEVEADFLSRFDPHLTKFGGYPRISPRSHLVTGHNNPIYYSVQEQVRLLADLLMGLKGRQFVVKRYLNEATIDPELYWIESTPELADPYRITEQDLIAAQEENLARYALPVQGILQEVNGRTLQLKKSGKGKENGKQRSAVPNQLA